MVRHVIAWEPARAAAYVLWLASAWVLLPLHERRRHPLRRPALVLAGAAAAVLAIATARATGALSAATVAVPGALLLAYASRRRRIPAIGFGSWLGRLRSWLAAAGHATEAALLSAPPEPAERG
jgi:hypothetical protein